MISGIFHTLNTVKFSLCGNYLAAGGTEKLVHVWKSNLKQFFKSNKLLDEEEAEDIEAKLRSKNELDVGTPLHLENQSNRIMQSVISKHQKF